MPHEVESGWGRSAPLGPGAILRRTAIPSLGPTIQNRLNMPCVKRRAQRRDQLDFRFELLREIERGRRRGEGGRVADMRCGEDGVGRREEAVEMVQEGEVVVEQTRVACHESTCAAGTILE